MRGSKAFLLKTRLFISRLLIKGFQIRLTLIKNLSLPHCAKEGNTPLNLLLIVGSFTSLWKREVRRDFMDMDGVIIIWRHVMYCILKYPEKTQKHRE